VQFGRGGGKYRTSIWKRETSTFRKRTTCLADTTNHPAILFVKRLVFAPPPNLNLDCIAQARSVYGLELVTFRPGDKTEGSV
jgi:hypothetical protein